MTVLFSYYATLGATTLAAWCWQGRPLLEVDWRVPFFLFTILVAVGEDYNILLITRTLQEKKKYGADERQRARHIVVDSQHVAAQAGIDADLRHRTARGQPLTWIECHDVGTFL